MTRSGSILTALAGTLLLAVVSAAPTPAAGGAPATGGTRTPRADGGHKDTNIRVATYNVEYASKPGALVEDVRRLTDSGVSIIALQEMGGRERRDALRAALVDCDGC